MGEKESINQKRENVGGGRKGERKSDAKREGEIEKERVGLLLEKKNREKHEKAFLFAL